jgi:hypothetical protein
MNANNALFTGAQSLLARFGFDPSGLTSGAYKVYIDGGSNTPGIGGMLGVFATAAQMELADKSNTGLHAAILYAAENLPHLNGVNWSVSESPSDTIDSIYNDSFSDDNGSIGTGLSWIWADIYPFLSAGNLALLDQQLYNDIVNPSNVASKTDALITPLTLSTGNTANCGTCSTTQVTLASGESLNFQNNLLYFPVAGGYGICGTYSGHTCTLLNGTGGGSGGSTWGGTAPGTGTAYVIYPTISTSNNVAGSTATVTGYNTSFTTQLSQGDAVVCGNGNPSANGGWDSDRTPGEWVSMVNSSVVSDTSLSVINSDGVHYTCATTGLPYQLWILKRWNSGDVGLQWLLKHSNNWNGSQPNLYPPYGGTLSRQYNGYAAGFQSGSNFGLFQSVTKVAMDFTLSGYFADARAALPQSETLAIANYLPHLENYGCGWGHWGANYGGSVLAHCNDLALIFTNSTAGTSFPSIDTSTTGWLKGSAQWPVYQYLPDAGGSSYCVNDIAYNATGCFVNWGVYSSVPGAPTAPKQTYIEGYLNNPYLTFQPASTDSAYLRSWLTTIGFWGSNGMWGYSNANTLAAVNPNNIGTVSYQNQPSQYLFQSNSYAACQSFGGSCPQTFRGDTVISRTKGWANMADTLLLYESQTWWGDRQSPNNGGFCLYKLGYLLGNDQSPTCEDANAGSYADNTVIGNMLLVGSPSLNTEPPASIPPGWPSAAGISPIDQWGGNDGNYGDSNSQYVYASTNLLQAYTASTNLSYARRTLMHFKCSGCDEFLMIGTFAAESGANTTQFTGHTHFPQTGEPASVSGQYNEGSTVYSGGVVTEVEDGGTDPGYPSPGTSPPRIYGLKWTWLTPSGFTVTTTDDGTSYTNGNGHTHRIGRCGGSSSCTSPQSVSSFADIGIGKIMQNLSDTTFTVSAINTADSNWSGAVTCGATSCAVGLMALGGALYSSVSNFTVSFSGTAQWMIGGLSTGIYTVTVGGSAVAGSPFTVVAPSNLIEFSAASGAVVISQTAVCSITTTTLPGGTVGVPYSQTLGTNGCTAPITWSVTSGSLCSGQLSLGSSTGTISGTPTSAQTCSFTVEAADNAGNTPTQPLTILVNATQGGSTLGGEAKAAGQVIIHFEEPPIRFERFKQF